MRRIYVYIVRCSDNSYYTGVTNNLERRIQEHNEGTNSKCYTFRRRPVELKYYSIFEDVTRAIEAEKQLKGWGRKKKEALFEGDWTKIIELAKSKKKLSRSHPSTSSG